MRHELSQRCSRSADGFIDEEYDRIETAAIMLVLIWPVAMPLVYLAVLIPARSDILQKKSTPLARATAFLHREYEVAYFWWEPVSMPPLTHLPHTPSFTPPMSTGGSPSRCCSASSSSATSR